MEVGSLKRVFFCLFFTVFYAALMLGAWRFSVDQWYLPAGIRAAALLFLPYRMWPYVFAGDAAAFLLLRGPKAEQYSEQWAYVSPFLLAPLISMAPLICRRLLKDVAGNARWLPAVALSIALWTAVCNMTLNYSLSGPIADNTLQNFLRYVVGQYLAILIIVPPLMVWLRRNDGMHSPRSLFTHALIAVGVTTVMFVAANTGTSDPALRQFLLLMMIAPAVALTLMHGWRGAALGVAVASVAFGLPTTAFDSAGAHDQVAFVAQIVLALTATAVFVFGSIISSHFDRARQLGIAEKHALKMAHGSFLSSERHLRDRVLAMAQIQSHLDESAQHTIDWLEDLGHIAAAADLRKRASKDARLFDDHAAALYPIRIEQQGLYDVLQSATFSSLWAAGTDVRFVLRGKARALSVESQLIAYRGACNAVAMLSHCDPRQYIVRARIWSKSDHRGIVISVMAVGGSHTANPSQASSLAALELEARVKTNGGAVKRRHANQVSFMLAESSDSASAPQNVEAGFTAHQSPLLV